MRIFKRGEMPFQPIRIVVLGLSVTSSWGNGHATTYRSLMRELSSRGHDILFLERDMPWYRDNRDMPSPPWGKTKLYETLEDLKDRFRNDIRSADLIIVGSYVPQGAEVGEFVLDTALGATAFYDIDTPITISKLERRDYEYLRPDLIPRYSLYLSFTGGPMLEKIERKYGSPMARPLFCSVDPEFYRPIPLDLKWDIGYIGTYSPDRQPVLEKLMLVPAARMEGSFVVAGPMYPEDIAWPPNTERIEHLPPDKHCEFYNSMKYTMNITRADMVKAGWSPSVRLFEAAACATPIISDFWPGLDSFFKAGKEIFISRTPEDTIRYLKETPEEERAKTGLRARERVLAAHTAAHRVDELEGYLCEVLKKEALK